MGSKKLFQVHVLNSGNGRRKVVEREARSSEELRERIASKYPQLTILEIRELKEQDVQTVSPSETPRRSTFEEQTRPAHEEAFDSHSSQDDTRTCPFCVETILSAARKCRHCGEFLDRSPPKPELIDVDRPVSRSTYIVLAILPAFIGIFGIHNLVAGYTVRGLMQLLVGIAVVALWVVTFGLSVCISFPAVLLLFVWVVIEACTVKHDASGRLMGS